MTPLFLSARRVSSSSSGLSSTRRMTLSLIPPRTPSQASSPFGRVSEDPPGAAVYPVGDEGVAVFHALVDFIGCVASVRQGYHGEQERERHEHYGRYAERHYGQDDRDQDVDREDDDPRQLVPERLQRVEAHPRRAVLVEEPDDERPERHEPHQTGQHAQVRYDGPRPL